LRTKRVLVVESDGVAAWALRELLDRDPRLTVVGVATDLAGAVAEALRSAIDLAVVAAELGEHEGFATVEALRQTAPDAVVIMTTACWLPVAVEERAFAAGARLVLHRERIAAEARDTIVALLDGELPRSSEG
jgi:DNA-binding NarL/FixJ family response regulator